MSPSRDRLEANVESWRRNSISVAAPAAVDFRGLAADIVPDRATHLMHAYPAKLIPHIPHCFLHINRNRSRPILVADPFCGSGTVLVEGLLSGCNVLGADSNPLARLIARVKTRAVDDEVIRRQLSRLRAKVRDLGDCEPPDVVNLKHWYRKPIVAELSKLNVAISGIRSVDVREFMQVCLSVCARKMSLADPRLSVPVRINTSRKVQYASHYPQLSRHLKDLKAENVFARFSEIVSRNSVRLGALPKNLNSRSVLAIHDDARTLQNVVAPNSVDLIITSPPYIGAQKYIRSSSLGLGWLGLAGEKDLRNLERGTIGREHYSTAEVRGVVLSGVSKVDEQLTSIRKINPLRAHIAAQYFIEMREALRSMHLILKEGANLVLIVGPNTICNQQFSTPTYLEMLAHEVGFETEFRLIDHIRSRGLMTKRNKTAGLIASEWVLSLRK